MKEFEITKFLGFYTSYDVVVLKNGLCKLKKVILEVKEFEYSNFEFLKKLKCCRINKFEYMN